MNGVSLALLTCFLVPFGAVSAQVQTQVPLPPGWYLVQPTAQFAVLQLGATELSGDSAADAAAYAEARILPGEVVLVFESSQGTHLVFEWFGRLSAVRGDGALVKAPTAGRPGVLTEDVQLLDRVLSAGSTLWVSAIDAGAGTATVLLDGDRRENVPSRSITVVMNAYAQVLRQVTFKSVQ